MFIFDALKKERRNIEKGIKRAKTKPKMDSPTPTVVASPTESWSSGCSTSSTLISNQDRRTEHFLLAEAILNDDPSQVQVLIAAGASVRRENIWVLYDACLLGTRMLGLLLPSHILEFGRPLSEYGGDSIFHFVLRTPARRFSGGKINVVQALLRNGVNPLVPDRLGDTALHYLAGCDEEESYVLLEILLEDSIAAEQYEYICRMGLNQQNYFGDTPLIVAALYNQPRSVNVLLTHGADQEIKGEFDMTALDFATIRGYTDIAELLLQWEVSKSN